MKTISAFILVSFFLVQLAAQDFSAYKKKQFIQEEDTLNYRILFPGKMKEGEKYPLLVFLHGAGERGNDNQKQLTHGASLFLEKNNKKNYPAVVLFPQCPEDIMWTHREREHEEGQGWVFEFPLPSGPTWPARLVNELVEELISSGSIDTDRIYIMGLSMGGIGTLEFLYRWPEKYASSAVICGGNDPKFAEAYCDIPVWFFHGAKDDVVPPIYSQEVYNELHKCNPITRYTLYPDANHNSWDPAFAEPKLLEWLFGFTKKP